MTYWHPLDTAPRDETDVLLRRAGSKPPVVAGWFEKGQDFPGWYSYDNPEELIEATAWAPLPTSDALIKAVETISSNDERQI